MASKIKTTELALRLRNARGKRPLREVQSEIGVSISTLSRTERAMSDNLDMASFLRICDWLQVSPCQLIQADKELTEAEDALLELANALKRAGNAINFILNLEDK